MPADPGAPGDASAGHPPHLSQPRDGGHGAGAGRLLQTFPSPALGQWAQAGLGAAVLGACRLLSSTEG